MNIFVWGTGYLSKELLENSLKDFKVKGFIDNNPSAIPPIENANCYLPKEVVELDYDLIIVASQYSHDIYNQAIEIGLDISKVLFLYNNFIFQDLNSSYSIAEKILSKDFLSTVKNQYRVIPNTCLDIKTKGILVEDSDRQLEMYKRDYVRIRTFENVANEIIGNNIQGDVAELGVFRGEFAQYIHAKFPDRICYLFDTFDGFRETEAVKEKMNGHCGDSFISLFRETSVDEVLEKMINPKMVVIKKGFFPESVGNLETKFAFVSIDVDFEESIYDGLLYFYPRLNKGGYIFIHDYNSISLAGVKRAVQRAENSLGRFAKVPIPDMFGTLVISK